MESKENSVREFKGTYYYNDIIVFGSNVGELLLFVCAGLFYYGLIKHELEVMDICILFVIGCMALYFAVCCVKIVKNDRIHMRISDEEVLVYRVYRLRPIRIKNDEVEEIQISKHKRHLSGFIRTNTRKHYVRNLRINDEK